MIALDQEKSLERMNWNFLFKSLRYFGYGPEITQKVKTVYQNIERQVKANGQFAARMPVIYDSVHYICGDIFREYKTKQWHQRYCNSQKKLKLLVLLMIQQYK